MKTIYVKVYSAQEAEEYAKNLYRILRDCTPVIADLCLKKAEVRTETVRVKYISNNRRNEMRYTVRIWRIRKNNGRYETVQGNKRRKRTCGFHHKGRGERKVKKGQTVKQEEQENE